MTVCWIIILLLIMDTSFLMSSPRTVYLLGMGTSGVCTCVVKVYFRKNRYLIWARLGLMSKSLVIWSSLGVICLLPN